ncbi:MAG: penicillin-binding protein 2 [bacterium]|nr:penicillin-binding protein 2 [bacterium]
MNDPFSPPPLGSHLDRSDHQPEDWLFSLSGLDEQLAEAERPVYHFRTLTLCLCLILLLIGGRLLQLQVTSGSQWRNLSAGNSVRLLLQPADRGLIFDSNGRVLAHNTKRATLGLRLTDLPRDYQLRERLYDQINIFTPITADQKKEMEQLRTKVTGVYLINTNLTKEQYLLGKEFSSTHPPVVVGEQSIRGYEQLPGLAHLLGYVGQVGETEISQGYGSIELVGKTGLEKTYESNLRGQPGIQHFEVDSKGVVAHQIASDQNRNATEGAGLKLALDAGLQQKVGDLLKEAIATRNKDFGNTPELGGTVIVLDPTNGQIKALVSLPDYDNNVFAQGITKDELQKLYGDPAKPLFNRATSGKYPPGSTIKPLIATGALYFNIVSPNYTIDTPPEITVGNFTFPDWKDHGVTNIRTAIAESNNIFFYMLGGGYQGVRGLGLSRIQETLKWFGLDKSTGIDLDQEGKGFILSEEWKRQTSNQPIYLGDVYHIAIGQGDVLATPLEMAVATAAIANGGKMFEPRLVAGLTDGKGEVFRTIEPTVKSTLPVDNGKLQIVREGMRQAVVSGSSRPLNTLKEPLAGKTGTAQFGNQDRTHAWFTGFGPFDDPKVVVSVLIEGGGGSFEAAIPLAEDVFRAYFNEPRPEPRPEPKPQNTEPQSNP